MIDLAPLRGSKLAVLGLARSGLATTRALAAAGVDCVAWDDDAARRATAEAEGTRVAPLLSQDWSRLSCLVISPGIPTTLPKPHPVAAAARASGVPIVCDVELLAVACPRARYVAVTGTNGKSTTTALIGHILAAAGRRVEVGGNIGRGALDLAPLAEDGVYVLELSSYQLELLRSFHANVAIWLNLTPDHLDRHGDMAGYARAKFHVFDRQGPGDLAIVGVDDEPSRRAFDSLATKPGLRRIAIPTDLAFETGRLIEADGNVIDFSAAKALPGIHNAQNAAAAFAACHALGVSRETIRAAILSFPGLPHRQERVAEVAGTVFVNDSKATNADATARALSSYPTIYWIAGGQAQEGGVEPLAPLFGRIRHAFLVGEASELFAHQLEGRLPYTRCGDLERALDAANAMAARERVDGAVVLLSPACASWDQWKSYEHRGDAFRAMARALPGARPIGRAA